MINKREEGPTSKKRYCVQLKAQFILNNNMFGFFALK